MTMPWAAMARCRASREGHKVRADPVENIETPGGAGVVPKLLPVVAQVAEGPAHCGPLMGQVCPLMMVSSYEGAQVEA